MASLHVTYCPIDASGVPAEWVEATTATERQPTIVYFLSTGSSSEALTQSRPSAGELAVSTGARVLTVACSPQRSRSHPGPVQRGVAAYRWLLGEGCHMETTAFAYDGFSASLLEEILIAARKAGLPLPGGTTWSESTDGSWELRSAITWV